MAKYFMEAYMNKQYSLLRSRTCECHDAQNATAKEIVQRDPPKEWDVSSHFCPVCLDPAKDMKHHIGSGDCKNCVKCDFCDSKQCY